MTRRTREPWIIADKIKVLVEALVQSLGVTGDTAMDGDLDVGGDITITGDITNVNSIQLNLDPTVTHGQGVIHWNADLDTPEIGMSGGEVRCQWPFELYGGGGRCKNVTGDTIPNGTAVRITGASGSNPEIELADPTTAAMARVIGITTEDIAINQFGYVTIIGTVTGSEDQPIDTSSYAAGTALWLGDDGTFTNAAPTAPGRGVVLGQVVRQHATEGVIDVNLIFNPALQTLTDVYAPSVAEGNVLAWDNTAERWEVVPGVSFDTTTGHLTLSGDATVWDDLRVAATATRAAAGAPGFTQLLDNGSGSTGVFAFQFDKTTEEQLYFAVQFPHAWREGSTIYPHVHWCPVDTNTGGVVWGLEYTWANIDGTFSTTTLTTVTQAGAGTAYTHQLAAFDAIDGTGQTHSSMMMCRLYRKAADAADTYDNDAALLEIDFHYEINQMGDNAQPGS